MVKGKGNEKGNMLGKEKEKEKGKMKAKEKSLRYLIRQESPLPLLVRKKGKPPKPIKKAKDYTNAPIADLICRVKKHPPPPPRLPDRTGAGVRAAEAAASGSATNTEMANASTIVSEEEEEEDDEDGDEGIQEEEDKDDEEYEEFVVPPGGDDMSDSDEDTSDGYKESAAELEAEGGDDMSDEELVHVISSDEEARDRNKKKTKRPRANAPVRTSSKVWVHFHKDKRPSKKEPGKLVLKACYNYCEAAYAYQQGADFEAQYFHVRCCAHILNLVVHDGTEVLEPLIKSLRQTVKYFKRSPSRLKAFVDTCKSLGVKVGRRLHLDCQTRWSSTYKMIKTARKYKGALTSHAGSDANYAWAPLEAEWDMYDLIAPLLKSLAVVTTAFSGSLYPTSNIFYLHIVGIKVAIKEAMKSTSEQYRVMAEEMLEKFDKYWEEKNNAMVIATVFDPRYKMNYIEWAFGELYGPMRCKHEFDLVMEELETLYDKCVAQDNGGGAEASASLSTSIPIQAGYESFLSVRSTQISKSELRNYLEDKCEPPKVPLDLLGWWKVHAPRYPMMAKIAKKFLTIPATSVSSESTFSTTGRILDDYRSSLKPSTVEALVCSASYIKGSHVDLNVLPREDEEDEDVETIKLPS